MRSGIFSSLIQGRTEASGEAGRVLPLMQEVGFCGTCGGYSVLCWDSHQLQMAW